MEVGTCDGKAMDDGKERDFVVRYCAERGAFGCIFLHVLGYEHGQKLCEDCRDLICVST